MKIPQEIYERFGDPQAETGGVYDIDTDIVLQEFDEPENARILEVGAHDEPLANVLLASGYRVTGIDLRTCDLKDPLPGYQYIRHDFCNLDWVGQLEPSEGFDSIISISAIEHFGLGTYGEGKAHPYYDVIALHLMGCLLKENGTVYLTVPYSQKFQVDRPHYRIYDAESLQQRLIQDFTVEKERFITCGEGVVLPGNRHLPSRTEISSGEADSYEGSCPHLSVFLKLRKVSCLRLAPDGR